MFLLPILVTFSLVPIAFAESYSERVDRPNLYLLSPHGQYVGPYYFPRNGQTLYHGTKSKHLDVKTAIQTMMGDRGVAVESPLLGVTKLFLLKQPIPRKFNEYPEWKKVVAKLPLQQEVDADLALKIALPIVNSVVAEDHGSGLLENFLNYPKNLLRPEFQSHEDHAGLVYSSIFQPSAAGYGDRIAVIEEENFLSLDANFYNYVHNGNWLIDGNMRPFEKSYFIGDAGEFVTATYVPASDMVGYQVRVPYPNGDWHSRSDAVIKYGLYKYELSANKNIILIWDGGGGRCLGVTQIKKA